jgi:hypothetical protein
LNVVLVVGFFDLVYSVLEEKYSHQVAARTLACIRQAPGKRNPDFSLLSDRLFDPPPGTTSVLVVLAVLKDYDWVEPKVRGMIASANSRRPAVDYDLRIEKEASSPDVVSAIVDTADLPQPPPITMQMLERVLGGTRTICITAEGRPSFRDALKRSGFPDEAWDRFFSERTIPVGKNSNLIAAISQEATRFEHLLYAWEPLRTLDAKTKKKFSGKSYEAPTAAKVVSMFISWIAKEAKAGRKDTSEAAG